MYPLIPPSSPHLPDDFSNPPRYEPHRPAPPPASPGGTTAAAGSAHPHSARHDSRPVFASELKKHGLSQEQINELGRNPNGVSRLSAAFALLRHGFSAGEVMEIANSPRGVVALKAAARHFPDLRKRGLSSTALITHIVSDRNGPVDLHTVAGKFEQHEPSGQATHGNQEERALFDALAALRHLSNPASRIDSWLRQRWRPDDDGSNEIAYLLPNIRSFEVGLARELFRDRAANVAVGAAIARLRDVLIELNPGVPRQDIESAFFSNDVHYANVGVGTMTLDRFLDAEDTNLRMRVVAFINATFRWGHDYDFCQSLSRILFDPANPDWETRLGNAGLDTERLAVVRERLAVTGGTHPGAWPRVFGHPESHGAVAEHCASRDGRRIRWPQTRERLRWRHVDYDRNKIPVSDAERKHVQRNWHLYGRYPLPKSWLPPDQEGPEPPWSWSAGADLSAIRPDSRWGQEMARRGQLAIAGISGSTAMLMAAFKWLQVAEIPDAHFLRAVYSQMRLPDGHSLYEILRGAQIADPTLFRGANRLQLFGDDPNSLGASRTLWNEVVAQAATNPAAARVIEEAQWDT